MSLLLKKGYILTLDSQDRIYHQADLLVEGDRIARISTDIQERGADHVIDARDKLVMPGINVAHAHSSENLFKGALGPLPLELWLLYAFPPFDWSIPKEFIYPRTILGAAEMIMGGATTVQDDIGLMVSPEKAPEQIDLIFQAYSDIGMRVNLMIDMLDKPIGDQFPFIKERIPVDLLNEINDASDWTADDFIELSKYAIQKWHGREGRLKYVLSPSGPQWCSDDFMLRLEDLSREHNIPLHTHLLETKLQQVTGDVFYGKSVVRHLHELGLLSPRMTLIHCIWVTDDDIRLMGDAQVSVVHNPASNMKLGSGLMPLRKLMDAGCVMALGVDGASSNDTQNPFEMLRMTALLHKISDPEFHRWPTSDEILRMATYGGARSELIHDEVGALAEGMKADIILLDRNSVSFTPFNDPKKHLVYAETGRSVDTSIINGQVVMENGEIQTVDVEGVMQEIRVLMPQLLKDFKKACERSSRLRPYFDELYERVVKTPTGLNRWIKDERNWL